MTKDQIIEYLKEHYPNTSNNILCEHLGLSLNALTTIANRNNIHKSKEYLENIHKNLMNSKEKAYLNKIPKIDLSEIEQNILVGSILGDGSLTFSPRSRNAYYREHFSCKQKEYREWKMQNLDSLQFRIEKDEHLKSPSHPIFTDLYKQFYQNNRKTITNENIKLLTHPIGLACLYMDDGTLMISTQSRRKNANICITPAVSISTLCYSENECVILRNHLNNQFSIEFKLYKYPSTKGYTLVCHKIDDVYKFYEIIYPYCCSILSMRYKWDIKYRLELKRTEIESSKGNLYNIRISHTCDIPAKYTTEDELKIIQMKTSGFTDKEIAAAVGRTYSGIIDKIRRMRQSGKL